MADSNLTSLPDAIGTLLKLKMIDLQNNQLSGSDAAPPSHSPSRGENDTLNPKLAHISFFLTLLPMFPNG